MAKLTEKELFLNKSMKNLQMTYEQAEELWSFDHNEIDNDIVSEIEAKTEKAKEKPPSKIGKVLTMKAKRKSDLEKENIIDKVFAFVKANMIGARIMTTTKITFKDSEDSYYTVAVTKHKRKPDGYGLEETVLDRTVPEPDFPDPIRKEVK